LKMHRQPSAVPPVPLETPRDISQEIDNSIARDLKKLWGGRFPTWEEFQTASKAGQVRANKGIGIKAIHLPGIPRGFWFLFGIVTPCGMIAVPIACISLAMFGVVGWWTLIPGLFASWLLYKVSLEGAGDAIRYGAVENEALYQALVCKGGFLFGPSSPTPQPGTSSADLISALGQLMERYPTALLDTARLPASKQRMKAVIKEVWQQEPKLRAVLTEAYLHLSQFQDGIGDAILDCQITAEMSPAEMSGPKGETLRQWSAWSKVSMAEMEILVQEWEQFERSNVPAPSPTDALRERAQRLVRSANIHATSLYVPMLHQFPLLRNVNPDQWDFVVTIASIFIAATRLRNLQKEDTPEEKLMEIVALGLADWDQKNGVRGFEDCKTMYKRTFDALTNAHADPRFITSDALGWWTVWNLFGREPKGEEELRLVRTIGGATVHAFFSWWEGPPSGAFP
jgi:hypothetical protein